MIPRRNDPQIGSLSLNGSLPGKRLRRQHAERENINYKGLGQERSRTARLEARLQQRA
jgi:hypothetical protein